MDRNILSRVSLFDERAHGKFTYEEVLFLERYVFLGTINNRIWRNCRTRDAVTFLNI